MTGQREKSAEAGKAISAAERIADIAHDLRSPLGGIDAMIELLAASKPNAEQERLIQGLRAASAHMRSVASDVIAPKAGESRDETCVGESLALFSVAGLARARARELLYRQEIAPPCETAVVASGTAMRQMLENIVDNAFRHTSRGVVSLRVSPALSPSGGPMVRFDVLDEGPGLTGEQASRIFQRGATLDDRASGSGLGLSIVATLADQFGGHCGAVPRPDRQGTVFWFTLPVIGYREAAMPARETAGQCLNPGQPILIIDDDATSRLLLKTVLGHLGFETRDTASPRQALEWLGEGPVAAVFTDVSMDEMNGLSLIRAIRALPGTMARVPVVSVSGMVAPKDQLALKEAGCDASVDKPITLHELRKALLLTGLMPTTRCAA